MFNWAQPGFPVFEDLIIHCEDGPVASAAILFASLNPSLASILRDASGDIIEISLPDHSSSELLQLLNVSKLTLV